MGKIYVVGLGNPGKKYSATRHNAGFVLIDKLAQALSVSWKHDSGLQAEIAVNAERGIVLMKPQTFINKSGDAVRGLVKYGGQYQTLYVLYDDLDLPVGSYKIQYDKGPKVHNGVNSIREALGETLFWHVRLGTDGRNGDKTMPSEEYVLQPFSAEEKPIFQQMITRVAEELHAKIVAS